ncbi:hypothetical protein Bca52824_042875 [Brassica carinata]|uniref:Uncharacterized protein n=1 Tax=Brassica carinata TaxID=52824 RepID=A0A8X7V053_BRACI|nr:hypothetical protein Bca52824_042875 [Brassica carinata]
MLVPSEIEVKHILLSAGVEESIPLMSDLLQGMILSALPWGEHGIISRSYVSDFAKLECSSCSAHCPLHTWLAVFGICFMGNSESSNDSGSIYANRFWPDISMFICGSKLATSTSRHCSVSSTNLRLLKLVTISPLRLSFGRERSSSTSSFSNERLIPPTSLFVRGDIIPVCKTGNNYKFPSRLLLCVKARLGPVGATTLIQMRVEVLDGVATSHTIVTNRLLFEDFEMRCKSFIDWIVSGNFDILISISCIKSY